MIIIDLIDSDLRALEIFFLGSLKLSHLIVECPFVGSSCENFA